MHSINCIWFIYEIVTRIEVERLELVVVGMQLDIVNRLERMMVVKQIEVVGSIH